MQMVKRMFWGLLLVWGALLLFMPKEQLYFKLERELAKQGIELNENVIEERIAGLTLKGVTLYVKGVEVARADEVDLLTLLFFSQLEVKGLHMDKGLENMLPKSAERIVLMHSILSPTTISIEGKGSFGTVEGKIDLATRTLHIDFVKSGEIDMLKSQLKQGEKGWYYETGF